MLRRLSDATAVMLTGGDQLRLLDILGGTEFAAELLRRGREGLLVGGSSAGSMALGDPVIVRGEPTAFYERGAIRHQRGPRPAGGRHRGHAPRRARPPGPPGRDGRRIPGRARHRHRGGLRPQSRRRLRHRDGPRRGLLRGRPRRRAGPSVAEEGRASLSAASPCTCSPTATASTSGPGRCGAAEPIGTVRRG